MPKFNLSITYPNSDLLNLLTCKRLCFKVRIDIDYLRKLTETVSPMKTKNEMDELMIQVLPETRNCIKISFPEIKTCYELNIDSRFKFNNVYNLDRIS